jgi:hypothetical protein
MSDANRSAREAFEDWVVENTLSRNFSCLDDGDTYANAEIRAMWKLWQALNASPPKTPAPQGEMPPDGISRETWNAMSANDRGQFLRNIAFTEGWKAGAESAAATPQGARHEGGDGTKKRDVFLAIANLEVAALEGEGKDFPYMPLVEARRELHKLCGVSND